MDRGVIVSTRVTIDRPHLIRVEGPLSPQETRRFILYHDRMVAPLVNGISPVTEVTSGEQRILQDAGFVSSADIEIQDAELERLGCGGEFGFRAGHVERIEIKNVLITDALASDGSPLLNGSRAGAPGVEVSERGFGIMGYSAEQIAACQELAAVALVGRLNERDEDCLWSIGQSGTDLMLEHAGGDSHDTAVLSLVSALPIPRATQKLSKILKFKERRRAELLALRECLDGLADRIHAAGDPRSELKRCKEDIERSLLDLHEVLDESGIQKFLGSLKTYLNVGAGPLAAIAAEAGGASLAESLAVGYSANAMLELVTRRPRRMDGVPQKLQAFAYVYDVENKKI